VEIEVNIVLTSIASDIDLISVAIKINPSYTLCSNQTDIDLCLADISLQLDQLIYFNSMPVDLVYVVRNINSDHSKVREYAPYIYEYSDAIYFTEKSHSSSFFCKPHVLSILGNLYKIDFTEYEFFDVPGLNPHELQIEKIAFMINRLGFDIVHV